MKTKQTRILIIDDETLNREIIRESLSDDDGYLCAEAEDGEQGLAMLGDFRPDIILLDIMMPGLDGYEVCRRIRANKRHRFTKVIMVTGRGRSQDCLAGYRSGADDYIIKPFDDDELLAKIRVFSRLKQAEEVEQLKSSVLTLFSHETRTPLNGIFIGCQVLLENQSLQEEHKETVRVILASGERLHDYVEKISLLCSLKSNPKFEPVSLPMADFLKGLIRRKQYGSSLEIRLAAGADNPRTMVDAKLFEDAFMAVLDNAMKFSPATGLITVTCKQKEENLEISVTDQGPGLDPKLQEIIFDEFAVADLIHHQKGSGLSMAISRTIMELHNGSLVCQQTPDQGASFIFTLPM